MWTIEGQSLSQLLLGTQEAFLDVLRLEQLSQDYLRQSRDIIAEYAHFCEGQGTAHPWQLRHSYLEQRAALRSKHRYSASYLENHSRELGHFLRWYQRQVATRRACWGELSTAQLRAYWRTQRGALPCRRRILAKHLPSLLTWLQSRPELAHRALPGGEGESKCGIGRQLAKLFGDYFEQHRRRVRGHGYGFVLTHRAQMVTRRHLTWLEQHGHLPSGTAAPNGSGLGAARTAHQPQAVLERLVAKVDRQLPAQLRQPLLDHLEYLIYDRQLVESSIESILRTNLALCRHLAEAGYGSYCQLRAAQLDRVVASLVKKSHDTSGLLRQRQQVQAKHGHLRGFLRYLQRTGVLGRELARVLISPPCYRAGKPATVLSKQQVRSLLGSVDRTQAQGRRCYAILVLMTTYGLRPVDVAGLSLDQIHWRQRQLALVQRKTGCVLTLPLLAEVVAALWDYLRQDRLPGLGHRRVFVSLSWPPQPIRSETVCTVVAEALHQAGLGFASAKHLRATVATHLLRQGEALSTIQEVLGHRTDETTQRYAVTDVELLRQVLEESER